MEIQTAPTANLVAPSPVAPAKQPPNDRTVPVVKQMDQSASLPPGKPFVEQVVNARLSGTDFPENPSEIAPEERTLRPYDVPMLPADKKDDANAASQTLTDAGDVDPDPFIKTT